MSEAVWKWALFMQLCGALIAIFAARAYKFAAWDFAREKRLLLLALALPILLLVAGLGVPLVFPRVLDEDSERLFWSTVTIYANSASLLYFVSVTGGPRALLIPLFLLAPDAAAEFLRDTPYSPNILIICAVSIFSYWLLHWRHLRTTKEEIRKRVEALRTEQARIDASDPGGADKAAKIEQRITEQEARYEKSRKVSIMEVVVVCGTVLLSTLITALLPHSSHSG